jgi:hypothetical protein
MTGLLIRVESSSQCPHLAGFLRGCHAQRRMSTSSASRSTRRRGNDRLRPRLAGSPRARAARRDRAHARPSRPCGRTSRRCALSGVRARGDLERDRAVSARRAHRRRAAPPAGGVGGRVRGVSGRTLAASAGGRLPDRGRPRGDLLRARPRLDRRGAGGARGPRLYVGNGAAVRRSIIRRRNGRAIGHPPARCFHALAWRSATLLRSRQPIDKPLRGKEDRVDNREGGRD